MKLRTVFISISMLVLSIQICFGQVGEQEENWLIEYGFRGEPYIFFRYDRYSKEDIVKFREKLDLMKNAKFEDEWESSYGREQDELSFNLIRFDSNVGFVEFNVYTCLPQLRYINYGKVVNASEYVEIFPEFTQNSPRKDSPVKYVKIKWGNRRYLVEESSVAAFAEKAVGIYVEPDEDEDENENFQKWSNYWVWDDSEDETENELTGLPQFPASYKKFERFPIETNIVSVGKRKIESEIQIGNLYRNDEIAVYTVTIGAGKNKGIKKGMTFDIDETGDEIVITQVNQNKAFGIIARTIDDNKNDLCHEEDFKQISCPKIKSSLKIKTRVGRFGY